MSLIREAQATCATGDCDNIATKFGWLHECDCLGEEGTYPNCAGHPYCDECVEKMEWSDDGGPQFTGIFGCLRCSRPGTIRSHHPDYCERDPGRPTNIIAAHFKAKCPEYVGIVWEAIANGAVRALADAGYDIVKGRREST